VGKKGYDAFWAELSPCEHLVQIYEDDAVFLDTLAEFVAGGIVQGEAVIVIATPKHREGLQKRLAAKAISVAAAQSSDQLVLLDAEQTMAQFLIDKWPDDALFHEVIGGIIERAKGPGRKVRAFGEMVAVMWTQGYCGATIRLEHLWADFCRDQKFSLFCAYPKTGFTEDAADDIGRLCALHTQVLSAEPN
jgi:hypothetical protein